MKKYLLLFTLTVTLTLLTACDGKLPWEQQAATKTSAEETSTTSTTESKEQPSKTEVSSTDEALETTTQTSAADSEEKTTEEQHSKTSERKNSEKSTEKKADKPSKNSPVTKKDTEEENYYNSALLEHVSDYVDLLDYKTVDALSSLELELVEDTVPQKYTGEIKSRYLSEDETHSIRLPFLVGDSEVADTINSEVNDLFSDFNTEAFDYQVIDYDAFLFEDLLSIKITHEYRYFNEKNNAMETQKHIVKTYHIDTTSEDLTLIDDNYMLKRIGTDRNTVKNFMTQYLHGYLRHQFKGQLDPEERDTLVDNATKQFFQNHKQNNLNIYKNAQNDYYSLEPAYTFDIGGMYPETIHITLAPSEIEMAMLSQPEGALGVIFKAYPESNIAIPSKNIHNIPVVLRELNPEEDGIDVYFSSFSSDARPVEICQAEFDFIETEKGPIYRQKLTPADTTIEEPMAGELYLYHTMLPETIPFEAICIEAELGNHVVPVQEYIYDDMRDGDEIQYIFSSGKDLVLGNYHAVSTTDYGKTLPITIEFKSKRQFVANGWEKTGITLHSGTFCSDADYLYLFPGEDDIERGAEEFYVFQKTSPLVIEPFYAEQSGFLNTGFTLNAFE